VDGLSGKFREISLPISAKTANVGYFSGEANQIAYWYQFQGNLQDSKIPSAGNRTLLSQVQGLSRWTPENTVYGLSVGPGDIYTLPAFSLASPEDTSGKIRKDGRFMLRFKPAGAGTVFSTRFESVDPSGMVYMNLNFSGESLSLDISGPNESAAIPFGYSPGEEDGFISLFIDFAVHDGFFEAGFSTENDRAVPAELKKVALSSPLTRTGSFQFGASLKPSVTEESAAGFSGEKPVPYLAVLDEFALAFRDNPLVGGEPEDETETPALTEAGALPKKEEPAFSREKNAVPPPGEEPDSGDVSQAVPSEGNTSHPMRIL
jgi:hypothetical protein